MKISVIVPIYNTEKYLHKCIDSILNQTFKDLEVILVDDGSTDSSGAICDEYSKKDNRVVVVHKPNGGLSDARNAGIDVAKGEYISFIDSDDFITQTMMETMYELAQKMGAEISITGRINRFEFNNREIVDFKLDEEKIYSKEEAVQQILIRNEIDVSVCDKLFKKTLFDHIRFPVGETNEDCAIIFRVILNARTLAHTSTADYYYCHRNNSISSSLNIKKMLFLLKNAEQNRQLIQTELPQLTTEAILYQVFANQIVYHNIAKSKTFFHKKISKDEKILMKKTRCFIRSNYRIIKKFGKYGKTEKMQLMLIKNNFYCLALKFYYLVVKKKKESK